MLLKYDCRKDNKNECHMKITDMHSLQMCMSNTKKGINVAT